MSYILNKILKIFKTFFEKTKLKLNVIELFISIRNAQKAVNTIDCNVSQIAKSLISKGKTSQSSILIVVSDINKISEKTIKNCTWAKLEKVATDFSLKFIGFTYHTKFNYFL